MGGVSDTTPAGSVIVLPQTTKTDGQPLLKESVGLFKLRQTQGDHVALETDVLERQRTCKSELFGGWSLLPVLWGSCGL